MFRKRTRDLVNLSQQAAQMEKTELSSSRESSPAPSLPPELQQLLEDSDEYFPEGRSSSSDSDSLQDIQWKVKRKKRCTGMEVLTTSNEVSLQSQSTTTSTTQSQKPSSFAAEEDIPILPGTSEDRQQSIGDDTSPATTVLDTPNSPSTSQHVRKSESCMIRKQRKINRNTGKAYQDSKGKEVRGRTCRRLENCRIKCGERFSYCDRNDIFNSYWALGDHSKRVSYIASLITVKEKKSERKRTSSPKRHFNRTVNYSYSLRIDGKLNDICKKCFMLTFDETNKFISNVIKKSSSSTGGITPIDKRGSHSPPNKISEEILEQARQHILSIPAYESHYSRRHTNKKYLPSHYTLALMYREYCKIADKPPICRTLYERIFHEQNLAIKSPKNDTCNLCDTLNMRMSLASEEERVNIEEKLRTHQSLAELAYESKKNDKKISETDGGMRVLAFDMQQCLPTPLLQSGVAFYKRLLWTFNLTVYDCKDRQAYCYMWSEPEGGRGANQVASCLSRHFSNMPLDVAHVVMYSDTCGGQNKNRFLAGMYLSFLKNSDTIKIIDHKFLVAGHTHLECDSSHAQIERKKKKNNKPVEIYHPHDWMQLVRQTGKERPFVVKEMKQEHFHEYSDLFSTALQMKKHNDNGEKFIWREVKWLRYEKGSNVVFYKETLSVEAEFKKMSVFRRGHGNSNLTPRLSYNSRVPITVAKKKDLLALLPLVPDIFHKFYEELPTTATGGDIHPDTIQDDEEHLE